MMDSDLLLMLGTDFPYQQFYPPSAYIIQVDIRGEQIGRRTKVNLGLVGDIRDTLVALKPLIKQKSDDKGHLRASLDHYKKSRKDLDSYAVGEPGRTPIHPQYVAKIINDVATARCDFYMRRWFRRFGQHGTPDEPRPEIIGILFARLDGKRPATGDWSPRGVSQTSGNLSLRRWGVFDAHG